MATDNFLDGVRASIWYDYGAVSESAGVCTIPAAINTNARDNQMDANGFDYTGGALGDFDIFMKVHSEDFGGAEDERVIGIIAYYGSAGNWNHVQVRVYWEYTGFGETGYWLSVDRVDTTVSVSDNTGFVDLGEIAYDVWIRLKRSGSNFVAMYSEDDKWPETWTTITATGTLLVSSTNTTLGTVCHPNGNATTFNGDISSLANAVNTGDDDIFDVAANENRYWLWTPGTNGTRDLSTYPGYLYINPSTGALWGNYFTHCQMMQYLELGFTIYSKIQNKAKQLYQGSGLLVLQDKNNWLLITLEPTQYGEGTFSRGIIVLRSSNSVCTGSAFYRLVYDFDPEWESDTIVYFKAVESSGVVTMYYSTSGTSWHEVPGNLTLTHTEDVALLVGFCSYTEGAPQIPIKCDYFYADTPPIFTDDEFDDDSVGGIWTQDLGDGSVSEANDQLTLSAASGNFFNANTGARIYQTIAGDFGIYTQVQAPLVANNQVTGLMFEVNPTNRIFAVLSHEDNRDYIVRYDRVGGAVYKGARVEILDIDDSIGLKISRSINTFTAQYSLNMVDWYNLGTPAIVLSSGAEGKMGVCAFRSGAAAFDGIFEFCGSSIPQNAVNEDTILTYEYPGSLREYITLLYNYTGIVIQDQVITYSTSLEQWITTNIILTYNYIRRWVEKLKSHLTTFSPETIYLTWEYTLPDGWPNDQPITFGIYINGECVINNVVDNAVFLPDFEQHVNYVIDVFANVFKNQIYSIDRASYGRRVKLTFSLSVSDDVEHYDIFSDNGTGTVDYSDRIHRIIIQRV